jgi:hypothetical protein
MRNIRMRFQHKRAIVYYFLQKVGTIICQLILHVKESDVKRFNCTIFILVLCFGYISKSTLRNSNLVFKLILIDYANAVGVL